MSRSKTVAEPDVRSAIALVTRMMSIDGPSGQESNIQRFIGDTLHKAGLPRSAMRCDQVHRRSPFGGQTGNLIARLPGTIRGPRRMLMAHVDTVPVCVGAKPLRKGNWIRSSDPQTGLGADNRSGAAAVLVAGLSILKKKLDHPPLTLFFPVQEEVGLIGASLVSRRDLGSPKISINFDGGDPGMIVTAATGAYRLKIRVEGLASHAGVHPEEGVSAITIASHAIATLEREGYLGLIAKGRRRGTSNVGLIHGGEATNVVAPWVELTAEVRSHDPRFRDTVLHRFRSAFESAARQQRSASKRCGRVHFDVRLDYEAFKLPPRQASVVAAQAAVRDVLGQRGNLVSINGGVDANWLTQRGIPTVTLGAGQHHAHTVDEALDVEQFVDGCRIGLRLATATEDGRKGVIQ